MDQEVNSSLSRFSILWYINTWGRLLAPGAVGAHQGEFSTRQILSGAILSQAVRQSFSNSVADP
jgi:hypothetical protein